MPVPFARPTSDSQQADGEGKPFGLIAGWGRLPVLTAEALKRQGNRVICCGIRNHADPLLATVCDEFYWIGMAKLGTSIRRLRRHGVTQAAMCGKIHKTRLLAKMAWLRHLPDWTCFKTFYPHFIAKTIDRKDDTILLAIVDAYANHGIELSPPTDIAPELLVKPGQLTRRGVTHSIELDIAFGWSLAREMGRLDIGQAVVVKGQAAIAVEAIEGTDACIRRAGQLCEQGGFTVVKVAKPQQDMRFDVPTIGIGTLKSLVEAGGAALAVEAERTIIIDEAEFIEFADRHGITVIAQHDPMAKHQAA